MIDIITEIMTYVIFLFQRIVRWDILDESTKVVFGSILIYVLARSIELPRIITTFWLEDELSALNGLWFGYRLHRSPADDNLEVLCVQYEFTKGRVKRFRSHCRMTTKNMRGGSKPTYVNGYATIEGDNKLLIQLVSSRPRDSRFLWPATAWFFNAGDTKFNSIKVGKSCSIAAGGDIVSGDILISRNELDSDTIKSLIQPFDRLSLLDARRVASTALAATQKHAAPA